MDPTGMSRREAGRRLLALAAAAGCAPMLSTAALGAQPRVPKKERSKPSQPSNAPPANPSPLDNLIVKGRSHDWTFKVWVTVHSYQHLQPGLAPIIETLDIATAAVVFPVNRGTASSELDAANVKGVLKFDDVVVDDQPKYSDSQYHSGTRLGRWEMTNRRGREMQLEVELPMTCWETQFDEEAASRIPWPSAPWPPAAASALEPDTKVVDWHDPKVTGLVKQWTDGKDPKSLTPVRLAKFLMGRVLEHCQPSGDGLAFAETGAFRGVDLQSVAVTASTGRGSEHDVTNLLASVYRAAGLPARTVIGYDLTEKKGQNSTFLSRRRNSAKLRAWVEFCLYDEGSQKSQWVPVDVIRMRGSGSRAPALDLPWKFFGENDELDDVVPFAFQYHPPTTVVAHGFPAFWGWFTTPELQVAEQSLRFDAQTTARRSNTPDPRRSTR